MDREVDFIWHPYVGIADGFSLVLLDKDVETDVSAFSKVRRQFGYDQGVPSENPVVLDYEYSVTPFVLQTGCSRLNKAPPLAMFPKNPRVRVLTRKACQYWNEIAIRFNDYAGSGGNECIFPPPPLAPINRSHHMKFSHGLIAYFMKEKMGFVAWHDEVATWVA